MKTLSEKFAELSAETKLAEERLTKAQTEGQEWAERKREEIRTKVKEALERFGEEYESAPPEMKARFDEMRTKLRNRLEEAKEQGLGDGSRAKQLFVEKQIEARVAVRYAIAATRLAELFAIQAIAIRHLAEARSERTPEPTA